MHKALFVAMFVLVLATKAFAGVTLDISVSLRGHVQDENGEAVAGVRVTADGFLTYAVTNEDGNFVLNLETSSGKEVRVRAVKKGCESADQYHLISELPMTISLEGCKK